MVEGQLRDSIRSIPNNFLHNENQSTIVMQTDNSDGADETGDASRIRVWDMLKTIGRSSGRGRKAWSRRPTSR